MKVLHLSTSDGNGGAAIAAQRIHLCLQESFDIESSMFVAKKTTTYPNIFTYKSDLMKLYSIIKAGIGAKISKLQISDNNSLHSVSCMPSKLEEFINKSEYDLIHLHWIQGEMISIEAIGRIRKPIIWTLHDNWAFSGSEHLPLNGNDLRFAQGYLKKNKPIGHKTFDLDRWCWQRKKNSWTKPIYVVCPSKWLLECARKSELMKLWDSKIIPHPLDTAVFKPWDKNMSRKLFKIPLRKKVILFGAMDGTSDHNKGWDLLSKALKIVGQEITNSVAVVFGQSSGINREEIEMPIFYAGKLRDCQSLAMLYSAADITIVPSRMESFGQIASESMSCGTPVIAFNYSGIKDLIKDNKTGYLVEPYNQIKLAKKIISLLNDDLKLQSFKYACREKATSSWSYKVVSKMYEKLYYEILR